MHRIMPGGFVSGAGRGQEDRMKTFMLVAMLIGLLVLFTRLGTLNIDDINSMKN